MLITMLITNVKKFYSTCPRLITMSVTLIDIMIGPIVQETSIIKYKKNIFLEIFTIGNFYNVFLIEIIQFSCVIN